MTTIENVIKFLNDYVIECAPDDGCQRCNEAREHVAALEKLSLPPAEGAEKVQRCPVCMGKGLVPNSFYATTSGIGSTTQTYLPEKCRTCNGAGVILPSYLQKQQQPTAEGAEEIDNETIAWAAEHQCGTPFSERWIGFVKGAKWHRSLHAQRIAEKMVEKLTPSNEQPKDGRRGK